MGLSCLRALGPALGPAGTQNRFIPLPPLLLQASRESGLVVEKNQFWLYVGTVSLTCFHCCCCCSAPKSRPTLWDPVDCSTPCLPGLHCLLEFAQTQSVELAMLSNHLILCHPLLLGEEENLAQPQGLFQ